MIYSLELSKLKKIYHTHKLALNEINLQVINGDFYALLGPNGAGKSTVIGIITSLINKTSGTVKVFGFDIDKDPINVKRKLGLVPQEFNFNPFETVLQILVNYAGYYGIPYTIALSRANKYLIKLSLWDKRNELARNLSGGMKRRLMIIRALIHEPKLLILDEPTSGVDVETRKFMWDFFKNLNKSGITIILTTHYFEEAEKLCHNIGIIQDGKLIKNTSIKKLLNQLDTEIFIFEIRINNSIIKLTDYNYRMINTSTLEVEICRKQGLNNFLNQLISQNIQIISISNKTNRLEKLFLSLINKK